jgi:CHAD domain-containing protein
MKARNVKGLEPQGTLADNAERIVRVRLDELQSFIPEALDPDEVTALHDMRIAAKRLRYIL